MNKQKIECIHKLLYYLNCINKENTMKKHNIALIGRPNVGKSTLFNRLIGKKKAIVSTIPGTTRDRINSEIAINNQIFVITDVGGFSDDQYEDFSNEIKEQIEKALNMSDLIIMIADVNEGITSTDKKVAQIVRNSEKKTILAVNKVDNNNKEIFTHEFYELGLKNIIGISAYHNINIDLLTDKISNLLPKNKTHIIEDSSDTIKISIVGRPNTGKSTLFNKLHGSKRSITSNIPGTTRDSIDFDLKISDQTFNIIDTPGIRRRGKINDKIEKVSINKAVDFISESNLSILLIDPAEVATNQDSHIIKTLTDSTDGLIIAVNKSDIIKSKNLNLNEIENKIRNNFKFLKFAPLIYISGLNGTGVDELIKQCTIIYSKSKQILQADQLKNFIMEKIAYNLPKNKPGQPLYIYNINQHEYYKNVFEFEVNNSENVHFSYKRFLENTIRQKYDFHGVVLKLIFKSRSRK